MVYPAAVKQFDPNVDDATDVNASYADQRDNEIMATQNALGIYPYGGGFASFLSLPALRAFWPFSSAAYDAEIKDLSGNGNHLVVPGSPVYIKINSSLTPYLELDGEDDHYLDSADATGSAHRSEMPDASIAGFTVGCWVYLNDVASDRMFLSQGDGASAGGSNWNFYHSSSGVIKASVFNGSSGYEVGVGVTTNTDQWYFVVMKYEPSTRLSITINGTKYSNTTSIPGTINSNALSTQVGAQAGANLMNGRIALAFMCGCALPDTLLTALFWQTRERFGV